MDGQTDRQLAIPIPHSVKHCAVKTMKCTSCDNCLW